jgi:glycosyltransferase involved in cell wall biosynthesis
MPNENDIPLVSVVVTTKNEERNIENCLRSIRMQTYKHIEVIVVDNFSSDRTAVLARPLADIVVDMGPERSRQRNHGLCELSRGFYALFIDADMVLAPQTIEQCVLTMKISSAVALHIDEIVLGVGFLAKIRRFERSFYSGTVIDGARFFERSIFCGIGGFDESLPPGPEDWDLDKRFKNLGSIALLNNHAAPVSWGMSSFVEEKGVRFDPTYVGVYHNEDEQSLRRYLQKKAYYGPSMSKYIEKWTNEDADVKRQLGLVYRYFRVFVEDGRWSKLLRHPVISSGMIALRLLVGASYLVVTFRANRVTKPNIA